MTNLRNSLATFRIPKNYQPLLFLGVCIAAFGLLIPFLGFYWDDWLTLYLMKSSSNPWDFIYGAYRPLHAILDVVEFQILGSNPLGWQILSLALRWAAVVLVWRLMRKLVPAAEELATWVAVLFAIYPSFHQQSSALIYRQHWTSYVFFLLSLLWMIEATRREGRQRVVLMLAGLAATLANLLTTEYLIGLEVLRPLILWMVIPGTKKKWRDHLRQVVRAWLPYLFVGLSFLAWRLFFLDLAEEPNPPVLIYQFLANPGAATFAFVQTIIQDGVAILWSGWADLLQPNLFDFADRVGPMIWIIVAVLIPALYFLLKKLDVRDAKLPRESTRWVAVIGVVGLFFGLATSWIVGRQVTIGFFSDRLSIPAMLGASILVALFIHSLIPKRSQRNLALAILAGFAIGAHLRQGNLYRLDWDKQRDLAWQFHWRAPSLEPGTLVIGEGALAAYENGYNAAFELNLWYLDQPITANPSFWYETYYSEPGLRDQELLSNGVEVNAEFYGIQFSGNTNKSAMVFNNPEESPCWWFLTPADRNNKALDPDMAAAAAHTATQAVISDGRNEPQAIKSIFGDEPAPNWCTVFQQASLSQQYGEWQNVLDSWSRAQEIGLRPYNGYELLPFIEAYAHLGLWQEASALSLNAYTISRRTQPMVCAAWDGYEGDSAKESGFEAAYDFVTNKLECTANQ